MAFQGRSSHKHMIAVSKKKPALQEIIDNLASYSIIELEVIQGQPEWIRKHLVADRKQLESRSEGYLTPEEIAERMTLYSAVNRD